MANNSSSSGSDYKATSIRVIEGLEAVRKRPAMYIGSTGSQGLHHLVYEIVDNSVDEALAGHADTVKVILHTDGSCSVEDNGRGIPTDIHPTEGISAAEVVLTKLHAGGKFDKDSYKYSGGLHGVGVSVVNALSKKLELTIFKDGYVHTQTYERGKPLAPLALQGETKKRGTIVRFWPDEEIFQETVEFSFETLSARLRELAFLNKKLRISIAEENSAKNHEFYFEGGIKSFVEHINNKKNPLFNEILYLDNDDGTYILELAMQYNEGYGEQLFSFVNNINTVEGGTHVSGFRSALTKICNKKGQEINMLKNGAVFSSEDVREGLVAVISMKVPEPQFEGQTKTKLGNNDVKGIVDSLTFAFLDTFFEENPAIARKILQKAEIAMHAREAAKRARDLTRRKTVLESMILPGKLADCSNENPSDSELFIVEGDSAGGSAKQGRDRHSQAILPLKGKILNVEKARLDKILSNDEIKALIAAIGCGIGDQEFDANKARYHKIILMTDADVDGAHIRTLLLTFFFRHMKPLIEKGYLYIAQPPLYKAKIGKKEQYLKDEKSLKKFLFDWAQDHTELSIKGKLVDPALWKEMLTQIMAYDELAEKASFAFRMSYDHCHRLLSSLYKQPWHVDEGIPALIENLKKQFKQYTIYLDQEAENPEEIDQMPRRQFIIFKLLNRQWRVRTDFFSSSEVANLLIQLKSLDALTHDEWTLQITGKDRLLAGQGVFALINGINAISKPYMNIQRYKGLGEMNPEQLWETSMDSSSRVLLKVTIADGLEADNWFTTLMGDDVSGRKQYIEDFGHFVKNLDI
ncbi:MAG: DNA topoisomerase (ATP-hydrolyzing) subunit B [Candidatus Dependentiae bacterium]|nr:DNA topoisomerase (ATP-hydrolyzing) subunit B [Candidatus Dependentiae bacterium]